MRAMHLYIPCAADRIIRMKNGTPSIMSKSQARAWKARWQLVNAMDVEEARRLTPDQKFESLVQLMHFALEVPETAHRRRGEREVARRWAKFRKAYGDCRAI